MMKTNLEALQSLYQIMTGESKEFTTNAEALEQIAKNYSSGGGKSLSVESIDAKIVNGEMVGWDKIKNTSVPLAVVSDVVPYVGSKSVVGGKISTPFHNYKSFSMHLAIQKVQNTSDIYISNGSQGIKIKANVSDKTVSIYDAKIDAWVTLCAVEGYKYLILKCTYSEGKFKLFGTVETVNGYSEYTDEDYNSLPFMYETTEDNLISLDRTYIDFIYDYPRIARFVVNGEYEKTFETSKLYNKKIIFTGDSICKNSGSYATLMENVKKCQSVNFSWGGERIHSKWNGCNVYAY